MASFINDPSVKKRRLYQILVATLISCLTAMLVTLILMDGRLVALLCLFVLAFSLCFILVKSNRLDTAATYVIILSTTMLLAFIWSFEGLKDEILLLFPAIVAFTVLISGMRMLYFVYGATIASIICIGVLVEFGVLDKTPKPGGLISALIITIVFSLVSYCIVSLGRDLTNAVRKLTESQQDLENQVQERTKDLQKSLTALESTQSQLIESEKMASLGRLVMGISHELNTPLGVAITANSHFESKNEELSKLVADNKLTRSKLTHIVDSQREVSDLLSKNLNRAASLVADFKSLSVLNKEDEISVFSLYERFVEIVISMGTELSQREIDSEIRCDESIIMYQQSQALTEVITQLIRNACLHAFEDIEFPKITLKAERLNDTVEISVFDNGNGLKNTQLDKLFEPFYTTSRHEGNTGLGLTIVYNLVTQILKGTISVDNTQKQGAGFVILLPIKIP